MKCHLVKFKSLVPRGKAFEIETWDGRKDFIPMSCCFLLSDKAIYIAAWILKSKSIQYSTKEYFYNRKTRKVTSVAVSVHIPERLETVTPEIDDSLRR